MCKVSCKLGARVHGVGALYEVRRVILKIFRLERGEQHFKIGYKQSL